MIATSHLTHFSTAVRLQKGLTIHQSCRIEPGTYHLASSAIASPILKISGRHIKVDFSDVTLIGDGAHVRPDLRMGLGLEITGNDIQISGLTIRGYKIAILASGCKDLKIYNCNFSWNYKQHLGSTLAREDVNDWQSYHHNENNEWFRYGAGAYLKDCSNFEVKGCTGTGEQCGLDLVKSNHGLVWNSDFSFNSGLGIGLYRSSNNRIMHNKMDWDVRGYSFGVYNRGQDSAGILLFEQCSYNIIAYNSITQGGDGFFLWAGQTTMDTGKGGCNDNLVYGNDFSGAITNGIEATFSRNNFIGNLVVECDNGLWGGYSYDSLIKNNIFALCNMGCAIEHGQNNLIKSNLFKDDRPAISLWAHPNTDASWGYPKYRDTRSLHPVIDSNTFLNCFPQAISAMETDGLMLLNNSYYNSIPLKKGIDLKNLVDEKGHEKTEKLHADVPQMEWNKGSREYLGDISDYLKQFHWNPFKVKNPPVKPLKGGMDPFIKPGTFRGRRSVLVNEWGPYDFQYPIFWQWNGTAIPANRELELKVLGPKGTYSIKSIQGGTLLGPRTGKVPGMVKVRVNSGEADDLQINALYRGKRTTDEFGDITPAGKSVKFSFSKSYFLLNWTLNYYQWDNATSPIKHLDAFEQLVSGPPVGTQHVTQIDYGYSNGWLASIPNRDYAIVAKTQFPAKPGTYKLSLTGDDGIRCFVDGKLVPVAGPDGKITDSFIYQGATTYTANLHLTAGIHQIRVEYFQIDGGRAFSVELLPNP